MQQGEPEKFTPTADVLTAALVAALGLALGAAGSSIRSSWSIGDGFEALTFQPLMGLAASAAGLGILVWWCLSLAIAVVGQLLQRTRHATIGRRISTYSPAFMRRLVLVVLSVNLVSAPIATASDSPAQEIGSASRVHSTKIEGSRGQLGIQPNQNIAPVWQPTETEAPETLHPQWKPRKVRTGTGPMIGAIRNEQAADSGESTVTVLKGDSLWSISAAHLGPYATDVEIAAEWPRWYAANKQTIGPNPNHLIPGQVLTIPANA